MITIIGLFVLCMVAAVFDVRRHRIPNLTIILLILLGVWQRLVCTDVSGLISAMTYCIIAALIMYPLYLAGALGAGDVKLYAVLPLFCIKERLLIFYLLAFFIAAVFALWRLMTTPLYKKNLKQFRIYLKFCFSKGFAVAGNIPRIELGRIPMAVPMAIGVLVGIVADATGFIDFFIS